MLVSGRCKCCFNAHDVIIIVIQTFTEIIVAIQTFTEIIIVITPYIRMLFSDWLMKEVFFLPILSFFSFSAIAGVFA
jgi:hypothetical protein